MKKERKRTDLDWAAAVCDRRPSFCDLFSLTPRAALSSSTEPTKSSSSSSSSGGGRRSTINFSISDPRHNGVEVVDREPPLGA